MNNELATMPTLAVAENEQVISEEQILAVLAPYKDALLALNDETKKAMIKSKHPELTDEELEQDHIKRMSKAQEQVESIGSIGAEAKSLVENYFYVHQLNRYSL